MLTKPTIGDAAGTASIASVAHEPFWRQPQVILLIGICLGTDFFVGPLWVMQKRPPQMAEIAVLFSLVGCALAQGSLLAAWLAWGNQPFGLRFRRHWLVAAILYLVWVAGLAAYAIPQFPQFISFAGLSVPLFSIATQLPFWVFRQQFGWRLTTSQPQPVDRLLTHSIRDLLCATALVAISLALARVAPSPGTRWVITFCIGIAFSAIATLPAAAILLRPGSFHRRVWLALLYAGLWIALLWLIVAVVLIMGRVIPPPAAVVVGASCLILSYAGTVILASSVARSYGYWLAWSRTPGT